MGVGAGLPAVLSSAGSSQAEGFLPGEPPPPCTPRGRTPGFQGPQSPALCPSAASSASLGPCPPAPEGSTAQVHSESSLLQNASWHLSPEPLGSAWLGGAGSTLRGRCCSPALANSLARPQARRQPGSRGRNPQRLREVKPPAPVGLGLPTAVWASASLPAPPPQCCSRPPSSLSPSASLSSVPHPEALGAPGDWQLLRPLGSVTAARRVGGGRRAEGAGPRSRRKRKAPGTEGVGCRWAKAARVVNPSHSRLL